MRVTSYALHSLRKIALRQAELSPREPPACTRSHPMEYLDSISYPGVPMKPDWKNHGLRIVRSGQLDTNTPQTAGMTRAEAISHAKVGAQKLWAGTVVVHPDAKTGPHHHGELETVIYVVRGRARFRWGDRLEFVDEAGPGDFVYVPPYVPHQELNAKKDEPVEAVIVRSGQEPVVVNLDILSPEDRPDSSEDGPRDDAFHSAHGKR